MKKMVMSLGLFVSVFVLTLVSFLPTALAQTATETVDAIKISGLGNYNGKFLTVYYAHGSKASVQFEDRQVKLRDVKHQTTSRITGDTLVLPATQVKKDFGFAGRMNLVVFVIHNQPQFQWTNADGSQVMNIAAGSQEIPQVVNSLTLIQLNELKALGQGISIQLSF